MKVLLESRAEDVIASIGTSIDKGLSYSDVSELRTRYGSNKLEGEEKEHLIFRFLSTFKDPLILMLLGSCALSIFVGQVYEFLFRCFHSQTDAFKKPNALPTASHFSTTLFQYDDAMSIGAAVLIVGTVAFVQEYRSEASLEGFFLSFLFSCYFFTTEL